MSPELSAAQAKAVSRISGLVLVNAMIFQEILADHDQRVRPLQSMLNGVNLLKDFGDHWKFITDNINYYPIFHVACDILAALTANAEVIEALRNLGVTAQGVIAKRAALRHDLMGRIYHRLLVEAKYLGTYYTSIPAATLLLKLALRPDAWAIDWSDLEQVRKLRIGDLACGTGTLLTAAAETVTDNYVSAVAASGQGVDISKLQNVLAEQILHGYDVLPSAIHLTASTLALRAPQIAFTSMNLFSLPLGGPDHRLGSLEFLKHGTTPMFNLFGPSASTQVAGAESRQVGFAPLPKLHLGAMNPPFTRSVGGNLLFGSVPEAERKRMQQDLKKLVRSPGVLANITAGLGSVFVAAAHPYILPAGRLALVLPKALLSGVAWGPTRQLVNRDYQVEYIVASQDPERWNFSESTSLSEALLVAVKIDRRAPVLADQVIAINLWRNPTTAFEALAVSHTVLQGGVPDIAAGQGALELVVGQNKVGEAVAIPWSHLKTHLAWLLPCAFAQSDLIRAAYRLLQGDIWVPGSGIIGNVPLCPLKQLAKLGPDRRDIHDGFKLSNAPTAYPTFWGHDAKTVCTLDQEPNNYLSPLPQAQHGRNLRRVSDLWPLAGRILLAERLWLKTQRLVALRVSQPVLSNVWWSLSLHDSVASDQAEKALALWLNSTLGLLLLLSSREETRGAWVDFKKPILAELPVLDLSRLSSLQLEQLANDYDSLSNKELLPLPDMNNDPTRAKIDESIGRVLNLPGYAILRQLLGREPGVCLRRL